MMNDSVEATPRFAIGNRIYIDHDRDLVGIVTAIFIRHQGVSYEVSYMHNGESKNPIIEDYRLTRASR